MQRLARIAGSFAIVLVAYWLYAHTAVQFVEPSIAETGTPPPEPPPPDGDEIHVKEMQGLFPPGRWELEKPMILDINNRAKLLLREYENLQDGRIKLFPCTMVFLYDGPAENEEERRRRSVVLEAPDGAIVKFDQPIDPKRLKIGRPVGGRLLGNITIRSDGKAPGPEDDLRIHARDLVWEGQDATSDHPVDFQWGKNLGSGSGLHIRLAPRDPNSATADNGPNVSGIEVFELRKIDRLHLEGNPNKAQIAAEEKTTPGTAANPNQNPLTAAANAGPTEITCSGAFRFDLPKRVASFQDHVEVRQLNPGGAPNQLLCDKLSIYFVPRSKDQSEGNSSTPELEPERIEALGKPVTVSAPNASPKESISGRGERLAYNLKTKLIELDGGTEVGLQQGGNEIHGKSLQYRQNDGGGPKALGKAWVKGPGWLRGAMDDKPNERLEARWNGELNLFPQDGKQVIALTGGAVLDFSAFGRLSAENVNFWFLEADPADPKSKPRPINMQARKNVLLDMSAKTNAADSSQISGAVDELTVWFEQKDSLNGIRIETNGGATKEEGGGGKPEEGPRLGVPATGISPNNGANRLRGVPAGPIVPAQYLGQQIETRATYRQPIPPQPQPRTYPQMATAATAPAVVRPVEAAAQNPALNANRDLINNPYIFAGPNAGNPPISAVQNNLPPGAVGTTLPAVRQQRFSLRGGTLVAKVLLDDSHDKPELAHLTVSNNVRLEETQTRDPSEKPLVITGDQVIAKNLGDANAASPTGTVTVIGQPAHVEGHGLSMSGSNLHLDRTANRLWIEGPGFMELPLPDHFEGQPLAAPGAILVKWSQGMNFDGIEATFEGDVDAAFPNRQRFLRTKTLKAKLRHPIRFSDPNLQNQKPDNAALISCSSEAYLESTEYDLRNERSAYVRLQAADLTFDLQSGELTASGPGWLNSVNRNNDNQLQNQEGIFLAVRGAAPPAGNAVNPVVRPQPIHPLMGTHVQFQGSITGNLNTTRQRILFNDRVNLLYAPVDDWTAMLNPDKTEPLRADEFRLKCDTLAIHRMAQPGGKEQSTELDAQGNSVVEGVISTDTEKDVMFTARAMRISYNTAKDQLILEGDGRSDVHLYRQLMIGGPVDDTAMKSIIYYRKTNTISTAGIQRVQINANGMLNKLPLGHGNNLPQGQNPPLAPRR